MYAEYQRKRVLRQEIGRLAAPRPTSLQSQESAIRSAPSPVVKAGACSRSSGGRRLLGDPFVDALVQHIQGECTAVENLIVEGADVEPLAQLILGVLAKLKNFQLSKLVGESLSGPRDI